MQSPGRRQWFCCGAHTHTCTYVYTALEQGVKLSNQCTLDLFSFPFLSEYAGNENALNADFIYLNAQGNVKKECIAAPYRADY
jgi:hypothetical protein